MRTPALPIRIDRGMQLNFGRTIRPEYRPAPICNLPSDDEIGALDAPDTMPAGAVYRAQSTGVVMQRMHHRPVW